MNQKTRLIDGALVEMSDFLEEKNIFNLTSFMVRFSEFADLQKVNQIGNFRIFV